MEELLFPAVRESYKELLEIVDGSDLLVTHPVTFAGPLVAYKTGIRWISTVLAPISFLSAYDPPVPPFWSWLVQLKRLGPGFMKVALQAARHAYKPATIYKLREELGVPDYGNPVFEGQHSPTRVLALFSPLFAEPHPDWPPHTRFAGFPFYDAATGTRLSDELQNFLDDGPPPIVFTLGSSAVWVARDFFQQSVAAAKALGRRAILVIGDERNLPSEPLPSTILAVDYAPFELLLPRSCLMIHHGGIGTTSHGLRAGVPALIVPFAFDQFDNAAHAVRTGTSRTLYRSHYKASRVAKELGILLDRPNYAQRAREISSRLKLENGAETASDLIEELLPKGQSMTEKGGEFAYASGH
jgi:UDP:flavonoid glycosyltransferase YjiC (YdhE family)